MPGWCGPLDLERCWSADLLKTDGPSHPGLLMRDAIGDLAPTRPASQETPGAPDWLIRFGEGAVPSTSGKRGEARLWSPPETATQPLVC